MKPADRWWHSQRASGYLADLAGLGRYRPGEIAEGGQSLVVREQMRARSGTMEEGKRKTIERLR